jgi:chitodextrinase
LPDGDANGGPQIVDSGSWPGVLSQIQSLKALGAQCVMVQVEFPTLYRPFLESQGENYQAYVNFYAQVAATVRSQGMKLVVENDTLFPSGEDQDGWNSTAYYQTLSWAQYLKARADMALVVAQTMHPDYLVLFEEPATEANNTGQNKANTIPGATELVAGMLASVALSGVTGMQVGAGTDTYQPDFNEFVLAFIALPLDFIDMHIYEINFNDLPNALTLANTAALAGLPVTMSECWLKKLRDSEVHQLPPNQSRARDPFSFWGPLDRYFVETMEKLAAHTNMAFLSPFGSHYFWSYLPYNEQTKKMNPDDILNLEYAQSSDAVQGALYTGTGMSYYNSLVSPKDTEPPSTPAGVTAGSANPNQATVKWGSSTDNVGVAGYTVWRDGTNIAQLSGTSYQDTGLQEATTYTYTIEAFDLGGNVSTPSLSAQVTTKDVTPPTAPANLVGSPVSSTKVALSWTASTDNTGIRSYRIFSGPSAGNLVQIGDTVNTTFNNGDLSPANTYYYGVVAVDTSGNVSAMSQVVPAATYALPQPPTKVNAAAMSSSQIGVSWAAGQAGLPIARYFIYTGKSASRMQRTAMTTDLTYTDRSLNPSTTYYYSLQAVDTAGDVSPMSQVAQATTEQ